MLAIRPNLSSHWRRGPRRSNWCWAACAEADRRTARRGWRRFRVAFRIARGFGCMKRKLTNPDHWKGCARRACPSRSRRKSPSRTAGSRAASSWNLCTATAKARTAGTQGCRRRQYHARIQPEGLVLLRLLGEVRRLLLCPAAFGVFSGHLPRMRWIDITGMHRYVKQMR